MPKVSVVIPIYNVEPYLRECLSSVINQTLQDIEILCVNDASTDHSLEVAKEFARKDRRISIVNNPANSGLSYSRNRGMELSQGEYIFFLDSDDMISREALEELYSTSKTFHLDGVFFDSTIIFESELLKERFIRDEAERSNEYHGVFTGPNLFEQFIVNNNWTASTPRQFWRRSYLLERRLKYFEGIIHEDELFTFQALLMAERVMCLKKKYFIRRYRANSIMTTSVSNKNVEGLFICYCEMLVYWHGSDFTDSVNKAIAAHISVLYTQIESYYNRSREMIEVTKFDLGHAMANHLFTRFISNRSCGILGDEIDEQKLNLIKQYDHVIIYGAGAVAREVLAILDENEISIRGFAVSDRRGNSKSIMGTAVYAIDELVEYGDKAVVLVSVVPKHQPSILEKLRDLNFEHVLLMI